LGRQLANGHALDADIYWLSHFIGDLTGDPSLDGYKGQSRASFGVVT